MPRHLQASRAQCDTYRAAIDADAGCPIRGVTIGGPDRVHPSSAGPGWTTTVVYDVLEVNPGLAVLEVPDDQVFRFGRPGIPEHAQSRADNELPPGLLTLVRARRGQDADGVPIPLLVGAQALPTESGKATR